MAYSQFNNTLTEDYCMDLVSEAKKGLIEKGYQLADLSLDDVFDILENLYEKGGLDILLNDKGNNSLYEALCDMFENLKELIASEESYKPVKQYNPGGRRRAPYKVNFRGDKKATHKRQRKAKYPSNKGYINKKSVYYTCEEF